MPHCETRSLFRLDPCDIGRHMCGGTDGKNRVAIVARSGQGRSTSSHETESWGICWRAYVRRPAVGEHMRRVCSVVRKAPSTEYVRAGVESPVAPDSDLHDPAPVARSGSCRFRQRLGRRPVAQGG
jgi:hypothetical protein